MRTRLDLDKKLRQILDTDHVYFQPPETVRMIYPCIVYNLDEIDTKHADDYAYMRTKRYKITVIDKSPDSDIYEKLLDLPMCNFDRFYTTNNLNHWVFQLYF